MIPPGPIAQLPESDGTLALIGDSPPDRLVEPRSNPDRV